MESACILWKRLDTHGHDACRLEKSDEGWTLSGSAAFIESEAITSIRYEVVHDDDWKTCSARISGWSGARNLDFAIIRDPDGTWRMNGAVVEGVHGSIDIDLGFTPATNTTAIRRLKLDKGRKQSSVAAWLDTADWQLKPLEQYYNRRSQFTYEYGSPRHGFQADLTIDGNGLVTAYPEIWLSEQ